MSTSTTIPVTVTPEASACIAQLGFQAEVDRMIDHVRQHLPEVERIEVVLYYRYDLGDEPGLAVDIYSRHPFNENESISGDLSKWFVRAFPSEVLEHVIMDYHRGVLMRGREFLELARELPASGTAPRHWRAVIIHAYYALFLECREAMSRWVFRHCRASRLIPRCGTASPTPVIPT
jgi:hypothetical protein